MNGAQIYSQSEDIILIQGDHREMIKFSYRDMHYQQVLHQLRRSLDNCGSANSSTERKGIELTW